MELPAIKIEDYIRYQIDYFDIDIGNYFEESIKSVIYYLGFNLRDCNKYFQALKLKYRQIKSNQSTRTSNVLFLHILFPLLLGMKIKRPDEYLKVKNGKGKSNFYNLLNSCESIKDYMGRYIGKDELSNLEKYINQLYVFIYINMNEYDLIIHSSLSITRNSCDVLDGFLSCLGEKVQL